MSESFEERGARALAVYLLGSLVIAGVLFGFSWFLLRGPSTDVELLEPLPEGMEIVFHRTYGPADFLETEPLYVVLASPTDPTTDDMLVRLITHLNDQRWIVTPPDEAVHETEGVCLLAEEPEDFLAQTDPSERVYGDVERAVRGRTETLLVVTLGECDR